MIYRETYAIEEGGVEEFNVNVTGFLDTDNDGAVDQLMFNRVEWTYEKKDRRMVRTAMKVIEEGLDDSRGGHPRGDRFPRSRDCAIRKHRDRSDSPEHGQDRPKHDDKSVGSLRGRRCEPRPIHRCLGDRRRPRRRALHRYLSDGVVPSCRRVSGPEIRPSESYDRFCDTPRKRGLSAEFAKYGPRFSEAFRRFDEENRNDPNLVIVEGVAHPQELLYAERLTDWVLRLAPEASEHLLLAARSQHIRRWTVPRASYEMTRAGYLKWRADLKQFHAGQSAIILHESGL